MDAARLASRLYSSGPLGEGEKPPKPYVLTEFRTKRHGRMGAETFPNLCTAQCPEGEKLKSVAGLKNARSENANGPLVPLTASVETLRVGARGPWQSHAQSLVG